MSDSISVLFVEDSKADQLAFERLVAQESLPYDYDIAGTIGQAEQLLQNGKYDLIIADHKLPDGTTFDLFPVSGETPIIITTGAGDEEIAAAAMKAGASEYLVKDFERNYLKILPVAVEQALRQKNAERQIQMLSQALMSAYDSVFITNVEDNIISINKAFTATYGYSEDEINGQHSRILWEDANILNRVNGQKWEIHNGEVNHRRHNDEVFPVWLTRSYVFNKNRKPIAIVHVARDVTVQKANQEAITSYAYQLETLNQKLAESELHLRELNSAKDKLFSIISHDLRNAFSSIRGYSELLSFEYDDMEERERRTMIERLEMASGNLSRLLENLLVWARVQTDSVEHNPEKMRVDYLVQQAIRLYASQAADKKIALRAGLLTDAPVFADANMIDSVIRNLVSNAIKFTPSGGAVTITMLNAGNWVQVEVKDSGVGIPPEMIEQLFQVGSNFSTLGTEQERGTGLGLLLCKELVSLNGGKIWAESKPGIGSRFYVSLPKASYQESAD